MAKARIFISSTCYDLSAVRNELDEFLSSLDFEVLNSEKTNFGVTPVINRDTPHLSCCFGYVFAL